MAYEFKLPDIGEGVVEGEIVKWLISAGDSVDVDQPLVEVMTDKATVVIPSPTAGTVKETIGAEGDLVEVGKVIALIEEGAAAAQAAAAPAAAAPQPQTPPPATPPAAPAAAAPAAASSAPIVGDKAPGGQVLAAPATRRLARELSVDISTIVGSGPAGRVTSGDVRALADNGAAAPMARAPAGPAPTIAPPNAEGFDGFGQDEVVPVRGIRRKIWESMTRAKFTAPHFTFVEECDATDLVSYRKRLNGTLKDGEVKLSFLPFLIKAVVAALKSFPQMNGQVDDANMAFVQRASYHIGIAVASDRGLVVPVIRHADRRSLLDLASEIKRLADSVRDGKIDTADLGGSTFTITSLGKSGGLMFTPVINYPEVAIMGVTRLKKAPVVRDDDSIAIREMFNLCLSFDHRLVDGQIGADFTYRVIELLQNPERLALEMG